MIQPTASAALLDLAAELGRRADAAYMAGDRAIGRALDEATLEARRRADALHIAARVGVPVSSDRSSDDGAPGSVLGPHDFDGPAI